MAFKKSKCCWSLSQRQPLKQNPTTILWNSSTNLNPLHGWNRQQATDHDLYERCCRPKTQIIKKNLLPQQITEIKNIPIPEKIKYQRTPPKWRQLHEKLLQDKADEEALKETQAKWNDWIKKRQALDLFQRLWEKNRKILELKRKKMVQDAIDAGQDPKLEPYVQYPDEITPDPVLKSLTKHKRKIIGAERAILKFFPKKKSSKSSIKGIPKARVMQTPFGAYREGKESRQARMVMPLFDRMLKNETVPEHNRILKSRHQLKESKPIASKEIEKVYKSPKTDGTEVSRHVSFQKKVRYGTVEDRERPVGAKFTAPLRDLLKSKKFRIPEHHKILRSSHRMNIKPEVSRDSSHTESLDPDWDLWELDSLGYDQRFRPSLKNQQRNSLYSKHRKSSSASFKLKNIKPKFTQDFRSMLKGAALKQPELHRSLRSVHDLLQVSKKESEKEDGNSSYVLKPKVGAFLDSDSYESLERPVSVAPTERSSLGHKLKDVFVPNPRVYKTKTEKTEKIEKSRYDKNRSMNFDRASVASYSSRLKEKGSLKSSKDFKALRGPLKKFSDYIKNSKPDLLLHKRKPTEANTPAYLPDTMSLQSKTETDSRFNIIASDTSFKHSKRKLKGESSKHTIKKQLSLRSVLRELQHQAVETISGMNEPRDIEDIIRDKQAAVIEYIKKLMKIAGVREDYRPPKEPRNFVQENINNIRNMSKKITEAAIADPKRHNLFATHYDYLRWHLSPRRNYIGDGQYGFRNSPDGWTYPLESMKPMIIRRYDFKGWRKLMERYWEKIKLLVEEPTPTKTVGEGPHETPEKCDCCICYTLAKGNEPDSALIKKIKTQWRRIELRNFYCQMRERERFRGSILGRFY